MLANLLHKRNYETIRKKNANRNIRNLKKLNRKRILKKSKTSKSKAELLTLDHCTVHSVAPSYLTCKIFSSGLTEGTRI